MFNLQPQEKKISLFCTDIQKMTPLHCASMFDHPELVEYLVIQGADINALGKTNEIQLRMRISFEFQYRQIRNAVHRFYWQHLEVAGVLCMFS